MTNISVNTDETKKTPVEGAPAKPAEQNPGNQSKPSEQQK
jgi:hypothetical protein